LLVGSLLGGCASKAENPLCAPNRVTVTIAASGVEAVTVRAECAPSAIVRSVSTRCCITISGTRSGGVSEEQPANFNWPERLAPGEGMTFVSKQYGKHLVVSSFNEWALFYHHYFLSDLEVQVPTGIAVKLEIPERTENGSLPDLRPPE
jgi:hypothetical protein